LNIIDIIVLVFLVIGAYSGFRKGLLMEIVAIIAFILAVIGGLKLLHIGVDFLRSILPEAGGWVPYVAFFVIFLVILLGVYLLGKIVKTVLDFTLVGSFDGLAGACLGILKWAFGLSLILWVAITVGIPIPEDIKQDAVIYPYIETLAPKVVAYASDWLPYTENIVEIFKEMFQHQLP
jgi:membrane protein required for colicin V production